MWRDWSQEGVLQEAKARGRENTTAGDYADSAPKRRVTTRERARCGHENESSHEEEGDGILVERMFESSNKASLGMIECSSMSIEEEEGNGDGMVIESVERSEKSENVRGMEIVSQLDGRGLHPNGGEASSDLMAGTGFLGERSWGERLGTASRLIMSTQHGWERTYSRRTVRRR